MNSDKQQFELLKQKTTLDGHGKSIMMKLYRKWIKKSYAICMTCDQQVRFTYNRLMKWYDDNQQLFTYENDSDSDKV